MRATCSNDWRAHPLSSTADVLSGDDKAGPGTSALTGPFSVKVTTTGSAVLGVSYPPSILATSLPTSTFETPRGHWAPSGCFSTKWVPTAADVTSVSVTAAVTQSNAADLQCTALGARARAAFAESAAVTARFYVGGRHALQDFDLVDVLPLPQTLSAAGGGSRGRQGRKSLSFAAPSPAAAGDSGAVANAPAAPEGGGRARGASTAQAQQSARAIPAAAAASNDIVVRDSPSAVLERPLAELNSQSPGLCARVHAGAGRGAFAPSAAFTTPSSETLDGVPGGYRMLDRRTVRAWFPGRVIRGRPPSAVTARGGGAAETKAVSPPSAGAEAYVYWCQPVRLPVDAGGGGGGGGSRLGLTLCCQPIGAVAALAPAGTFTVPYVPGQAVEARTLGGSWAAAEVAYADRYCLRLRVTRPPPPSLSSGGGGRAQGCGGAAGARDKSSLTTVILHSRASGDRDGAAATSPLLAAALRQSSGAPGGGGRLGSGAASAPAAALPRSGPPPPPPRPPPAVPDSTAAAAAEQGEAVGGQAVPLSAGDRGGKPPRAPPRPAAATPSQQQQEQQGQPPGAGIPHDAASPTGSESVPATAPAAAAPTSAPNPRRRTESLLMGIPQIPERGLETVPHQLWQLLLARPGHFCLREEDAPASVPIGKFGFRFFSSSSAPAPPAAGSQAAVARALVKQGRGSFA